MSKKQIYSNAWESNDWWGRNRAHAAAMHFTTQIRVHSSMSCSQGHGFRSLPFFFCRSKNSEESSKQIEQAPDLGRMVKTYCSRKLSL